MGLSEHCGKAARRTVRWVAFVLALCWIWIGDGRAQEAKEEVSRAPLFALAPRQAVLVCYCPDLERLSETWRLLSPLRESEDTLLDPAATRFRRLDEEFLQVWAKRLGLTMSDIARALPGEVLIGWMPRIPSTVAAFKPDDWVLVARRSPGRDEAVRELWRRAVANMARGGRTERRSIGGVAVEQVVQEGALPSEMTAPRRSQKSRSRPMDPAAPNKSESASFGEVRKVERRALSLGLSGEHIFFAPSRAERLEPWIHAAIERQGTIGQNNRLSVLLAGIKNEGELALAIEATPPAWVPPVASETERRLGAHPEHVLFSQARSLEGAVFRRGDQIVFDAQVTLLPPPGWAAQILGTLTEGAAFSTPDGAIAELCVHADFARLWTTLRTVLAEGWPAVGFALDTFLAPQGGKRAEGMGQLMATWGGEAAMFAFRPAAAEERRRSWAILLQLRDSEQIALFDLCLKNVLQTFSRVPAIYNVSADGRLQVRTQPAPTTTAATLADVHIAHRDAHVAIAGSRAVLEKVISAPSLQPKASRIPEGSKWMSVLFPDSRSGRRPSIVLRKEIFSHSADGLFLGGRTQRIIRTPDGTITLDSPPPEAGDSGRPAPPIAKPPAPLASEPLARLLGALVVESENSVRARMCLQPLGSQNVEAKRPRLESQKRPVMQE